MRINSFQVLKKESKFIFRHQMDFKKDFCIHFIQGEKAKFCMELIISVLKRQSNLSVDEVLCEVDVEVENEAGEMCAALYGNKIETPFLEYRGENERAFTKDLGEDIKIFSGCGDDFASYVDSLLQQNHCREKESGCVVFVFDYKENKNSAYELKKAWKTGAQFFVQGDIDNFLKSKGQILSADGWECWGSA